MERVDERGFNQLLDLIYSAAVAPERWLQVVDDISDKMSGTMVVIHAHDVVANAHLGAVSSRVDPDLMAAYDRYYGTRNIWVPAIASMAVGKAGHPEDSVPQDVLLRSEFYNDFLKPLGGFSTASGIVLHRDAKRFVILSGNVRTTQVDTIRTPLRLLLDRLAPHLARSFALMHAMSDRHVATQLHVADELVRDPVFLLTSSGKIVHANGAGQGLLNEGTLLGVSALGRIFFRAQTSDRRLGSALHAIGSGDLSGLRSSFRVFSGGRARDALVVPFTSAATTFGPLRVVLDSAPAAILVLRPVAPDEPPGIIGQFRLTAAETALATALAGGTSLKAYAEAHGLSHHTVRNQLQAIYAKTETHRQSQLVALLLGSQRPPQ